MKRSEINNLMKRTLNFLEEQNFKLPPFAFWSPEEWGKKGKEVDEIKICMLGWDLTDFGSGEFHKTGLIMFTIRNGHNTNPRYMFKPYCEKILISEEDQVTPMHFHWNKVEDIINRGGGNLVIQLYNSTKDELLADTSVTVSIDGVKKTVEAGARITLVPGESICLPAKLYHKFWGEKGKGTVLIGEVSKVNDDNIDNRFYEKIGRFPEIEEDEKPLYLLFSEYPKYIV
ncbi:MAG: D-lyxose/D-mannose family sugar isomerase [bacterium]